MSGKYALDSNVIIDVGKGLPEALALRGVLNDAERYISVISRMESLAFPGLPPEEETHIRHFLGELTVIPLDDTIEETAITLCRTTSLRLPDAIIAATALSLGADIISRDEHLLKLNVPGLRVVKTL
ncbi:MAG: type II toxin-antitoxin system VapC family toxin, partial [Treponema sp.]|jgi:predicted nucleic acid-binding protein|nr:type II toxin-antitoxin system VapC family toxin [Treponema sp.]